MRLAVIVTTMAVAVAAFLGWGSHLPSRRIAPDSAGARFKNRDRSRFRVGPRDKARAYEYFAARSGAYDDAVSKGPLLRLLRDRERASVLRSAAARLAPGARLIDVGCGGGHYSLAAKQAGMHVRSVDICAEMIAAIRPHVDEAEVLDIDSTDHPRGLYDLVICAGVLEFVLDPERSFRNLAQLVAPGGRLVVLVPRKGAGGLYYRLEKWLCKMSVNIYSESWFVAHSQRAGLRLAFVERPLPHNMVLAFDRPAAASATPVQSA